MTDQEFWELIQHIDTEALDRGDEKRAVFPLQSSLSGKSESELVAFEEMLAQKLFAIDGWVYAENAGEFGFSNDGFLYARLYVVAKGLDYYEAVRFNPVKMPKSIAQWCEPLLYTYRDAWAKLSGREASEWPFSPSVSYESTSNGTLWPRLSGE